MEIKRNIMKDRNSESPESSLKVNYVVNFGKDMTQRTVKLNPVLFRNNKIVIPKKKFRISESRKEEFNSYSNENMDFFRLDHISECDRNNYHNIFMDKLKPINRSSNFQKFNEIGKNIKYLDYLKENILLNQNKKKIRNILSDKEMETYRIRKKYYTQEVENNILPNIPNINNIGPNNNNDHNLNHETIDYDKDVYKNKLVNPFQNYRKEQINNNKMASLSFRSMNNPFKKYSNSYISNINDYCIQEGDKNLFPEKGNNKLYPIVQKNYINNEQIRRLYNIEKKINYKESPFYLAYNERNNNGGFKRRGEDISSYEKIRQNKDYFGNKKNSLDKNEYRDMKNFNSHNFHKKRFSSSDN